MRYSDKHNFHLPEVHDDVLDSIEKYAQNFENIDELIDEIVPNLEIHLIEGKTYNSGKKIWNKVPTVGDYVGWVNIRTGVHAPKWSPNQKYSIGDLVVPDINNGHYYQCITEGTSSPLEPNFPLTSGDEIEDLKNITFWQPSTVYSVGDIVRENAGDKEYFYQCIVEGTSGEEEPSWVKIEGTTIVDGSVSWYVYKTVKWKEMGQASEFRPFGKID